MLQLERQPRLELVPGYLKDLKAAYESHLTSLLSEGKTVGEIANRPYLDKTYPQIFSLQMGFLLMFWKDDNSAAFEQTDPLPFNGRGFVNRRKKKGSCVLMAQLYLPQ